MLTVVAEWHKAGKNGIRPREKRENGKSWPELASTNLISPLLLLLLLLLQCCCGAVAAANAATAATSGAPSTLALSHSHNMNNNWDQLIHHHYDFLIVVPLLVKFSGGKHFFSFTSQHFSAHFPLSLTRPLSTWWKTFSLFLELPLLLLLLLLPLMSFLLVVAEMGRPCSLRLQMALLRAAVLVAT
uniref:HDC11908 n=1 Tax=Drosophila melanogaster TaxID=7227 RepID=Q6IKP5_DROME|nr:TPA_inf: HDC11908 [Drosophila melanogaster]